MVTTPALSPLPQRIVLLGASNFIRGLPSLLAALESALGNSLQVLAAVGHGRSYGQTSTVLGRTLPGIRHCGLWRALDESADLPTFALVGDIGNDILFGSPVPEILKWVKTCLDRLAARSARTVLCLPPMRTLATLKSSLYYPVRTCLYPKCPVSWADAMRCANELEKGLVEIASERGLPALEPEMDWIGFDHIHVRRRSFAPFWQNAVSLLTDAPPSSARRFTMSEYLALKLAVQEERTLWGIKQGRPQPSVRLRSGTTVGLY